jgi:hypothetical protein
MTPRSIASRLYTLYVLLACGHALALPETPPLEGDGAIVVGIHEPVFVSSSGDTVEARLFTEGHEGQQLS